MSTTAETQLGRFARSRCDGPASYQAGSLIVDKYRLDEPLGEGGMGMVWLARNVILDAPVALKLLHPDVRDRESTERLLIEARIEANLRHPNIIRVFDFGQTASGDAFMVMEVLHGISLEDFMAARGALSPIEAAQILLPVVDALACAHENGVVHRDLKPSNIFLDRIGRHMWPKLLDFGIAKLSDDESERHRTHAGMWFGSPPYMAPEQALAEENVDHRADIWAMCVVLYEAVSGRIAFPGEGYVVLRAVIDDDLAPLAENHGGETSLWPIISRGLCKDPDQRFQSMRELGTALAQWLANQGVAEDLSGNRLSRVWAVQRAPDVRVVPERRADRNVQSQRARAVAGLRRMRMQVLRGCALALALLALVPSKIGDKATAVEDPAQVALARVTPSGP